MTKLQKISVSIVERKQALQSQLDIKKIQKQTAPTIGLERQILLDIEKLTSEIQGIEYVINLINNK